QPHPRPHEQAHAGPLRRHGQGHGRQPVGLGQQDPQDHAEAQAQALALAPDQYGEVVIGGASIRFGEQTLRMRPACLPLLLCLALPSSALGAPAVTNTADDGPGSLRAAIAASAPGDTIDVPASATPYLLTTGDLDIDHALTIRGAGARTTGIDAGGASRVVYVSNGSGDVTLAGLTITGGNGTGPSVNGAGGGIYAGS